MKKEALLQDEATTIQDHQADAEGTVSPLEGLKSPSTKNINKACQHCLNLNEKFVLHRSMIPPNQLPYVSGRGPVDEQELRSAFSEQEDQIVPFIVNRNLRVYVSLVMCKLFFTSKLQQHYF